MLEWLVAGVGVRIECLGEPGGEKIDFGSGNRRVGVHLVRHQADEVSKTQRRLQNSTVGETVAPQRGVHTSNDDRRRVVRVEGRGAGGRVFILRQKLRQIDLLLEPVPRIDIEHLRQPAPADIPHKDRLFVVRGRAFFGFEAAEEFDCLDVGAELLLERPLADAVAVGDPEVGAVARWA